MNKKPPAPTFEGGAFSATEWDGAEQKRRWAARFARWLLSGCPEEQFGGELYRKLSQMFGHIAHYNAGGFYGVWFAGHRRRWNWLAQALSCTPYGRPAYTWCDVEQALIDWLKESPLVDEWQQAAAAEDLAAARITAERAMGRLTPAQREEIMAMMREVEP